MDRTAQAAQQAQAAQAAHRMAEAARRLLDALGGTDRRGAAVAFTDPSRTSWSYLPGERPGARLGDLGRPAAKAAYRLLATALSRHAFAQAVSIMGLEEVLDLDEDGRHDRHAADYWIRVFGDPGGADPWAWRLEGHHVSATLTITGDRVSVTPCFLGANPATVGYRDSAVIRPLPLEEWAARDLLAAMAPDEVARAVVAEEAPRDIRTSTSAEVGELEPYGIPRSGLRPPTRDLLDRLVDVYLDRLAPDLATAWRAELDLDALHFAWEGAMEPGRGHYYRVQAPGLLIEYDNTQNSANHIHAVLRRPGDDFGATVLARHYAHHHPDAP